MKRTGVFATEDEAKEIIELHRVARSTPVIALSVAHGINSGGFAGEVWTRLKQTIHSFALTHGLPEIEGFYGFDGRNNEFLSE